MHHLAEFTMTQKGKMGLKAGALGTGLLDIPERLKAGFCAPLLLPHPMVLLDIPSPEVLQLYLCS